MEFLLDQESIAGQATGAEWQFFPAVHGQADYGVFAGSQHNQAAGGLNLNLDLIRWQRLSLFTHLGMHLDSSSKTFGPDKMLLFLDYGLRYDWTRIFLEGFVRQAARLDVYQLHDGGASPNMAGVRLGTQGMRLGHYDDGISFEGPELFQWLHKVNAQVSLAHYFNAINWPATWNVAVQGRWDILRRGRMIPLSRVGWNG